MRKTLTIIVVLLQLSSGALFAQSNSNPDISIIGNFSAYSNFIKGSAEYGKLSFGNPEFEMYVDGYLNPYAKAAVNIAYEDGEFGVEELYANILNGLPFDLQLKAGKFLTGFGKLNTTHPHSWPFLERPLFHKIYLGNEGFNDIGVSINYALPTEEFYSSIDLGIFKGDAIGKTEADNPEDEESIKQLRGINPVFIGRLGTFFTLGDFSNLELGLSGSFGLHAKTNYFSTGDSLTGASHASLNYFYGGIDFKYKYKPDSYTALTIQGEGILNNRQVLRQNDAGFDDIKKINTTGAFIFIDYLFSKHYSVGLKYDFTYGIVGDIPSPISLTNDDKNKTQGISAWFGYYPVEETIAIKLGVDHLTFNYADGTKRDGETTVKMQMLFSLGPHKAHPF